MIAHLLPESWHRAQVSCGQSCCLQRLAAASAARVDAATAAAVKVELDEAYKEAEAEQGDTFDAKLKSSYVKDVIAARAKYGTPTFVNGKRMM